MDEVSTKQFRCMSVLTTVTNEIIKYNTLYAIKTL